VQKVLSVFVPQQFQVTITSASSFCQRTPRHVE